MLSKKVLTGVVAALVLAAGALTAVAAAHTLSTAKARDAAQKTANKIVRQNGDYVSAQVTSCTKLFPHRVRCRVGFDDVDSRPTSRFACADSWMMIYKAHDSDEPGDPRVYYQNEDSHAC